MTAHTFFHTSEFVEPGASTIEVHLEIRFEHSKADPDVGAPESVAIEHIRFDIGDAAYDFNGDYQDDHLVTLCWEHLEEVRERAECDRADMLRDERGAQ